MKNIMNRVSDEDRENARLNRQKVTNPPDSDPGMSDWDWDNSGDSGGASETSGGGWGDLGGGGSSDPFSSGNDPFSSGGQGGGAFGNGAFGGGSAFGNPFGANPFDTQNNAKKEPEIEEKFFEGVKKVCLGFFTFAGEFVKSFKTFGTVKRLEFSRNTMITSILSLLLGVVLMLFNFLGSFGFSLLMAGLVSLGLSVPLFMFSYDKLTKGGAEEEANSLVADDDVDLYGDDSEQDLGFDSGAFSFDTADDQEEDEFSVNDDDEEEDFSMFEEEEEDYSAYEQIIQNEKPPVEEVLANVEDMRGLVTRQYLYETFSSQLSSVNPSYDRVRDIPEDSAEFEAWDSVIQESARILKQGSDVEYPYLISASERLFYYHLVIKRVPWLKVESLVSEIVNIYRYDEATGEMNSEIYGLGDMVGDKVYIKIMKGETASVSLKDIYPSIEKEIKDTKNYMPVVLGLDLEGRPIWKDFRLVDSMLITGMPRSGKTWLMLLILQQFMLYLKPSELNIYILDPKGQASDLRYMLSSHVRKFKDQNQDIVNELRYVVEVLGAKRKEIIGGAGFVTIWDYKKKHPDADMPLIYVVVDELISVTEGMSKEQEQEFQSLLMILVSQLPAFGIRVMMIPHMVKDSILKKTTSDLITCRVSVKGDANHIENSVGVKGFKHRLTKPGNMALRMGNDTPIFVSSAILSTSNEENQNLFEITAKIWDKIEPESSKGSFREQSQRLKERKEGVPKLRISQETNEETVSQSPKNNGDKRLNTGEVNDILKGFNL